MYLLPLLAPCVPLLPRGTVPLVLLLFCLGCPSCRAHRCSRAPCVCTLLLLAFPLPRRPVPSPPVTPFLPSSPPICCHSDGPVCTFPSAVSAVAVHSPACATRGFYLCPILLSLPFPLVSGRTLTLPTLMCDCPQAVCYAPLPRLSPHPGHHGFTGRGSVYMRTGLRSCLWTGLMMGCWDLPRLVPVADRAIPHAASKSEPPMGPTIANALVVGPALRAGSSAPCHRRMFSTGSCPSRGHAEYPRRPSASGIAARFHTTARRTPPAHQSTVYQPTSTAASCQASRSGLSYVRHPRNFLRPATRRLRPHPSALLYSTAPAAVAVDPVPSSWGSCLRLPSPHPPLPCWPSSTAGRVPATSCSAAPPRLSSTPGVPHACPRPSPSLADSPSLPLLQLSLPLVRPSTLHSPCARRPRVDEDVHCGPAPAPPYASPSYHPSRCNSSRSFRTLGFFPRTRRQSRLTPGSAPPREGFIVFSALCF